MVLADGVLGQAMEPVVPPTATRARATPTGRLTGADGRPPRVVRSLHLQPEDLEAHNAALQAKFRDRRARGPLGGRATSTTPRSSSSRTARPRGWRGRRSSVRASRACAPGSSGRSACGRSRRGAGGGAAPRAVLVVELSAGQLVEDVRLAVEGRTPVFFHGRTGGMVPTPDEVVEPWARPPGSRAGDPARRRR